MNDPRVFVDLRRREPLLWCNPRHVGPSGTAAELARVAQELGLGRDDILRADARLRRWAPALARLFPELEGSAGLIESPLEPLPDAAAVVGTAFPGRTLVKRDDALPVSGSIKARGGFHEVLVVAENIAREEGLLAADGSGDLLGLLGTAARERFASHTIAVGSTGNLGLSIGIMAAALGFRAVVHMSHDARAWKKALLRSHGVAVIEHAGDYSQAVAAGREEAQSMPRTYFVDDEGSRHLLLGYAVAALRLKDQLDALGVAVDAGHPLIVYLPCGVGGAPGGITFGLKHVFGDAAHCFFAEPCASPAMLVRLASTRGPMSVRDVGLDNITAADGLSVASASELVNAAVGRLVDGVYTVADDDLFRVLFRLYWAAGMRIEPSAAAAFLGVPLLFAPAGRYCRGRALAGAAEADATHVFWTTGGAMVPAREYEEMRVRGALIEHPIGGA